MSGIFPTYFKKNHVAIYLSLWEKRFHRMYVIIELKSGLKSSFSFFLNQLFIQSLPSRLKTYSGRFSI